MIQPPLSRLDFLSTRKSFLGMPSLNTIVKAISNFTIFHKIYFYLRALFIDRDKMVFDESFSGFWFKSKMFQWNKVIKNCRKEYLKLQSEIDFSKKFIYVPLHYQPECTTDTFGDIYTDQILMIDTLAYSLPEGWVVYTKENLSQWRLDRHGSYIGRYQGYFKELSKIKNVFLISPKISTFDLIEKSQVVATVTGTVGWEAVLRSKPAITFGYPWYMHCEGVFRVDSTESCREILEKINSGYKVDKQKVINYLAILDKNSVEAYAHDKYKHERLLGVSYEENVKRLANAYYQELI